MREKGKIYEDIAEKYLIRQGYQPLAKNFQCRAGEIDLIMQKDKTLTFVEVRYRKSTKFGTPEETITRSKQAKVIRSAQKFISEHNLWSMNIRFDVVAITQAQPDHLNINWISDAFN